MDFRDPYKKDYDHWIELKHSAYDLIISSLKSLVEKKLSECHGVLHGVADECQDLIDIYYGTGEEISLIKQIMRQFVKYYIIRCKNFTCERELGIYEHGQEITDAFAIGILCSDKEIFSFLDKIKITRVYARVKHHDLVVFIYQHYLNGRYDKAKQVVDELLGIKTRPIFRTTALVFDALLKGDKDAFKEAIDLHMKAFNKIFPRYNDHRSRDGHTFIGCWNWDTPAFMVLAKEKDIDFDYEHKHFPKDILMDVDSKLLDDVYNKSTEDELKEYQVLFNQSDIERNDMIERWIKNRPHDYKQYKKLLEKYPEYSQSFLDFCRRVDSGYFEKMGWGPYGLDQD